MFIFSVFLTESYFFGRYFSIPIFLTKGGKLFRFSVLYSLVFTDESNTHAPTDYLNATKATLTEIRRITVWLFSGVNIHTCIIQIAVFGVVHQLCSITASHQCTQRVSCWCLPVRYQGFCTWLLSFQVKTVHLPDCPLTAARGPGWLQ